MTEKTIMALFYLFLTAMVIKNDNNKYNRN